jgi:hypothetical protein
MLGTRATRSAPASAPGDDARGTHAHSGAPTHTEGSAPPQSPGVRVPERTGIDCELEGRVVRAAPRPPAGAAFRWSRRLGALFSPRGGSAQVARALCPALPTIGWEVSLAAGSLGSAGEQGHAPSFFVGVDVDFPSRTTARARRSGRQQRPRRSRGSRRRKGRTLEMRAMDIGEPAARTRSSRSRIRCRASDRTSRLSGKSRPSLRASPEKVPA